MLRLYDYFRSSASFRVRIALNLKQLPYQIIPIHLVNNGGEQFHSSYETLNPQHLVPTLQENNKTITQSIAIIEYLNEAYPSPPLLPEDLYEKALARSFALAIACDIHPLNNLRVLNFITNDLEQSEEKKMEWYHHWLNMGLASLEKLLTRTYKDTKYSFGNSPTIADICLVPQMYNARRFSCDLTPYPLLKNIDSNCQHHPAFQKAWPEEV